jgi:hypothetical protein
MPNRTSSSADDALAPGLPEPDVDVLKLGDGPPTTLDGFYQTMAKALGQAAENAVQAQQQTAVAAEAATTQSVAHLYALDFTALIKRPT